MSRPRWAREHGVVPLVRPIPRLRRATAAWLLWLLVLWPLLVVAELGVIVALVLRGGAW